MSERVATGPKSLGCYFVAPALSQVAGQFFAREQEQTYFKKEQEMRYPIVHGLVNVVLSEKKLGQNLKQSDRSSNKL